MKDDQAHCGGDPMDAAPTGLEIRSPMALERVEPSINDIAMSIAQRGDLAAVEAIERLFRLQVEKDAIAAKRLFYEDLAKAQAEIPQIDKHGMGQSKLFARLQDIDTILRPIMAKYGFALSFDEKPNPTLPEHRDHTGTLSHEDGHSETKCITLPVDKGGNKNNVQAVGSSASYAQRYLTKKHFAIVEKDEDQDGYDPSTIGEERALDLIAAIEEVKGNKEAMLKHFKIEKLSDLLVRDLSDALQMIEDKRAGLKKK